MPNSLLNGWSADPVLLGATALVGFLFARGRSRLLAEPQMASQLPGLWTDAWWRSLALAVALLALALAACSPVDAYAGTLLWVHMIQHLLVLMFVCPLLVAAAPWVPVFHGLPVALRNWLVSLPVGSLRPGVIHLKGLLWRPFICFALYVVGVWVWHWPTLYDRALQNETLHNYGEHNTFLLVGILFWLQVIPSAPFRPVMQYLHRSMFLVAAIVQNVALSVILGFAGGSLFAPYAHLAHRPGGLSAHADQQIGAAIMWSLGDLPFVIAIAWLVQLWLRPQFKSAPIGSEMQAAASVTSTARV